MTEQLSVILRPAHGGIGSVRDPLFRILLLSDWYSLVCEQGAATRSEMYTYYRLPCQRSIHGRRTYHNDAVDVKSVHVGIVQSYSCMGSPECSHRDLELC